MKPLLLLLIVFYSCGVKHKEISVKDVDEMTELARTNGKLRQIKATLEWTTKHNTWIDIEAIDSIYQSELNPINK